MSQLRISSIAVLTFLLSLGIASASWYDDYDAGLAAARKGQWSVVVQKMTSAINGNGKENDKARTYGAIFINYHPYYYRGVANLNLGRYEQAISDFEKTAGPGELALGDLDALISRAKTKLEAESSTPTPEPTPPPRPVQPPPTPTPVPVIPTPVTPTTPTIDAALRTRAQAAVNQARAHLQTAQQRKATASPQYAEALRQYTDANSRLAGARSNDDLNSAIAAAENAALIADSAVAPGLPTPPTTTAVAQTRPAAATDVVFADSQRRVRAALESYFNGEFDEASRAFEALSRDLPRNGWIWAFLGASQYSQYAFEADESYKSAAMQSFRRAKQLRRWGGGLPDKYFSKRIRRVFEDV